MILFQIIDIFLRLDTFQRGQEALKNDFKHGIHYDAIETRSKLDKNSRKKKKLQRATFTSKQGDLYRRSVRFHTWSDF